MSYIIALTGGICSGKSTIAKIFSQLPKISIVDADLIAKKVTQPKSLALLAITRYFGSEILLPNGFLNRSELKRRIFLNPIDKKWLEKLLHPIIQKETQKEINILSYKSLYILWVVPLLIENNLQSYAHRTLVVDVHPDIQLLRIINRDKINERYAENILFSQSSRQCRLNYANDILDNNQDINDIKLQILTLHQFYTNTIMIKNM